MLNIKSTKKALVTGIISMSLCSAMLVGSTYAWFTDNDNTQTSTITAGNLEVNATFNEEWTGKTFEPGAVVYESVNIENVGDVNAKYKFSIDTTGGNTGFDNAVEIAIIDEEPTKGYDFDGKGVTFVDLANYNSQNDSEYVKLPAQANGQNTATKYIVLRWKTNNTSSVDNLLKKQILQIKVDALAIQDIGDEDGLGNTDYDELADAK